MKINKGNNYILSIDEDYDYTRPTEIYINNIKQDEVKNKYTFNETINIVILIWNNTITNCYGMFYSCNNIIEMNLSHFDTSQVTDMGYMFAFCSALVSFDLSNFYTSQVTDMTFMFEYCSKLVSFDLSNFNTSQVTNMNGMFGYYSALTSLD